MTGSYWANLLDNRIGRRRLLLTTGGSAAAAAFIAACGGGSNNSKSSSGGTSDKSSLVAKPVEVQPAQAKRGGTLSVRATGDPATLDPAGAINPLNPPARIAINTLVRIGYGTLKWPDNTDHPGRRRIVGDRTRRPPDHDEAAPGREVAQQGAGQRPRSWTPKTCWPPGTASRRRASTAPASSTRSTRTRRCCR